MGSEDMQVLAPSKYIGQNSKIRYFRIYSSYEDVRPLILCARPPFLFYYCIIHLWSFNDQKSLKIRKKGKSGQKCRYKAKIWNNAWISVVQTKLHSWIHKSFSFKLLVRLLFRCYIVLRDPTNWIWAFGIDGYM